MNTSPGVPYYFSAWTGYDIPVKPHGLIDYERAESYEGFNVFLFDENSQVVSFESWSSNSTNKDPSLVRTFALKPGTHFFLIGNESPEQLGGNLSLEATKDRTDYYRVRVDNDGTVTSCERIHRTRSMRHEYKYWENGKLRESHYETTSGSGTRRFDNRGNSLDSN